MELNNYCHFIINAKGKDVHEHQHEKGKIYLGGVSSLKEPILKNLNITAVLTILDSYMYKYGKVGEKLDHLGIKERLWIDLEDMASEKIAPHFEKSYQYLKQTLKNHNVLVHCQMGISRSASLVIAYLMKEHSMSFLEAKTFTKNKRNFIQPNYGFVTELVAFQQFLNKQNQKNGKQQET